MQLKRGLRESRRNGGNTPYLQHDTPVSLGGLSEDSADSGRLFAKATYRVRIDNPWTGLVGNHKTDLCNSIDYKSDFW